MIKIKNINKTYGKEETALKALDNVSFEIPNNVNSVAIVGKSGSGKSTLMHVISGLDRPDSGEIIIDKRNILKFNSREMDRFRSGYMSFIFQSFFVQGNETCYDNVSLPLEISKIPNNQRKKKIHEALEAVGLGDKIKEKAKNLSGGQKQRLAIARAMANDPKILFADEPTGNLDSVTSEEIEKLLFGYSKREDTILIIVTHDDELANKCDIKISIRDGRIVDVSPKKEKIRA